MKIRNWDKWQSYRTDRAPPPWIKVHRALMHDPNWVSLTDAQRGQLVSIWMLGAQRNGDIPDDGSLIQKICHLECEPDLNLLIEKGFLDANLTPRRRQRDAPEEKRIEENRTPVRQEPDGFSEFYLAYPKKQSRKRAEKAYKAARKDASHADIMAGLERAKKADRRFLDFQFTPQPASWLNAGGWADETKKTGDDDWKKAIFT